MVSVMHDDLVARRRDEFNALRMLVKLVQRDAHLLGPSGLRYLRDEIDRLIGLRTSGLVGPITLTPED